jgi:hypothetical protein
MPGSSFRFRGNTKRDPQTSAKVNPFVRLRSPTLASAGDLPTTLGLNFHPTSAVARSWVAARTNRGRSSAVFPCLLATADAGARSGGRGRLRCGCGDTAASRSASSLWRRRATTSSDAFAGVRPRAARSRCERSCDPALDPIRGRAQPSAEIERASLDLACQSTSAIGQPLEPRASIGHYQLARLRGRRRPAIRDEVTQRDVDLVPDGRRVRPSWLKAHRSSSEPPPRPMMIRSTSGASRSGRVGETTSTSHASGRRQRGKPRPACRLADECRTA